MKATSFFLIAIGVTACSDQSGTTQIGNTNTCIPDRFMVSVGSSPNSSYDKSPDFYEVISIDPSYIQEHIPEYKGYFGEKDRDRLFWPLHATITKYEPYTVHVSQDSSSQSISNRNPNLIAYSEWPHTQLAVFDRKNEHWGDCSNYSYSELSCKRNLRINDLNFYYSLYGSNIDLYPEIDAYLEQKVTEEWHCDQ